ncbi:MAG: hypothetical protein ACOCSR_00885, partial [Wenzhouxiangella sp.]
REPGIKLFHAPLFAPAIRMRVPVVPVAIRYDRGGDLYDVVVFGPGESFGTNLLRIMAEPPLTARLMIGEPIEDAGRGRRDLANRARETVKSLYHG